MTKRTIALLIALILVVAACGDSGGGAGGTIDSCDELGRAGVNLLQDILDEVSGMSLEEFSAAAGSEEDPEFLTKFEGDADRLDAAQERLGCSEDELNAYLVANLDDLSATGAVGELMLEALRSDPSAFTN